MGRLLNKVLDQKRLPVFTLICVLVAVTIEMLIIAVSLERNMGFAEIARFPMLLVLILGGSVLNTVFAAVAAWRDEYPGGIIAGFGSALWIVTALALWQWR
jgi:hypothetical protein